MPFWLSFFLPPGADNVIKIIGTPVPVPQGYHKLDKMSERGPRWTPERLARSIQKHVGRQFIRVSSPNSPTLLVDYRCFADPGYQIGALEALL